jgi:cytoskeletal protein RodZ
VATTIGDAKKEAADIQAKAVQDAALTNAQGQAAAAKEGANASTSAAETRAKVERERGRKWRESTLHKDCL